MIPVDDELATVSPVNAQVNFVIKQLSPIIGFVVTILAEHRPASTSWAIFAGQLIVGLVIVKVAL